MPTNGEKLPKLYNSNNNRNNSQFRRDSLSNNNSLTTSRDSLNHRSTESAVDFGQRSRGRIGHHRIDVNRRPLGSRLPVNNNSIRSHSVSRSMEGNVKGRNWDSEGGRPKSPQRQPAPRPAKKTGFRKLLQKPSFDGLMPFQRAPRDGSYEKTLPISKGRSSKAQGEVRLSRNMEETIDEKGETTRYKTPKNSINKPTTKSQDSTLQSTKSHGVTRHQSHAKSNNVPVTKGHKEKPNRQSSPTLTRLLRRKRSQDRGSVNLDCDGVNSRSSTDVPPLPLPISRKSTLSSERGPNSSSESPWERVADENSRNGNANLIGSLLPGDSDETTSLPSNPPRPTPSMPDSSSHLSTARDGLSINRSSRPGSTLIDLSPRETSASTTNPRHSLNNDINAESSFRDPYSTLVGNSRRNSSPVPPPRTSASMGARETLLNHSQREAERQPNSVFRHHLRQTPTESQDSLPRQRQRANSEQPRTSSPRFRNLLSRRGSSSSNSSRENSQNNEDTSSGNERRRSRTSFWRNSIFSRLGSAERRSRSRSESAASTQSNSSQEGSSSPPQPSAARTVNNSDPEIPGFPFRHGSMSSGRGFNPNDASSRDATGPRIIRLTLGPSGADIGRLLAARSQDAPSTSGGAGSSINNEEELGMHIALMGSPLMSPPVDLTTIPPRLLLSFLLQGRRELGNEFVELVLENLLLSILARHMMEVGGQVGGSGAHPPATQEMIDKLEGFIVEQQHVDDDLNCAICHVEYELSEKLSKLPCSHFFHPTCITIWLKKSATCPVCRFKLTRPSETPVETL